ncbi:hypothetical protein [Pedobacter mendelii]|uniref:Uncharacterized protein n=1 Tax=Pedobacter mendelii TaxID=1908240 RepID=A0ABQ2BFG6_9SPHI|nr:hypothetical protein [Pedobacter mendelii]GGI23659.1 hypothetical protein GCM10008119_08750 [Pedobacter mendelii]
MTVLITYDIKTPYIGDSKNKAVKDAMKEIGYYDTYDINSISHYLPNTCLFKQDITPEQAKGELLNAAVRCSATIERLFATEVSDNHSEITGEPF